MLERKGFVTVMLCLIIALQLDIGFGFHKYVAKSFRDFNRKVRIFPGRYDIQKKLAVRYPVTDKKPLVVVIASYNNVDFCKKNLQSVFNQTYDNYRVIYIDDCSKDGTFEKVKSLVEKSGLSDRFTLIRNPVRRRKMPNLYEAFQSCKDNEIIVCLDGDDWFAHDNVLQQYNEIYQNPDIWLTYGSAIFYPTYHRTIGAPLSDKELKHQKVRDLDRFEVSMPRTFYAGLFKQIKLKDFFYQEKYIEMSDDPAFMFPMIEMAGEHVKFCEEIQYIINNVNPISDHYVSEGLQTTLRRYFQWEKEKYPMKSNSFHPSKATTVAARKRVDLLILSENSPLELEATLRSYEDSLSGLQNIYVLFKADNLLQKGAYEKLKKNFPYATFFSSEDSSELSNLLKDSSGGVSPYLAVSKDNFVLKKPINLTDCTAALEKTHAVSFILGHMDKGCDRIKVTGELSALQLKTLARNTKLAEHDLFSIVQRSAFTKLLESKGSLFETANRYLTKFCDPDEIALFYNEENFLTLHNPCAPEKALNHTALLKMFQEGKSIDLKAYTNSNLSEITRNFIVSGNQANSAKSIACGE